jgi:phage/plasmid primase-like uncharacterized protein
MSDGFSRYDTITEFRDAFPGAGLVAPAEIIADGEWHRCDVAGKRPRNEDGRYKLYTDRWPAGVLQNFVEGRLDIWHPEDRGRKVSAEERAERKRFADQAWADAVAETVDEQAVVATGLELRWGWMTECDGSQYLARKRVGAHGVRAHMFGSIFYVPVRDIDGKLWNLQEIWSDGSKLFQKGGRVTGCFHTIGDLVDGEPIQIGEGYATCASAFESNGVTTIVAFDAGNMPRVAKALRERYSLSPITLLADDDAATRRDKGRNPGIDKATEAALAVGGKIAIPDFGPDRRDDQTDFNDLHLSVGFAAVRRQIAEARDPDPVEPTYAAPIHTVDLATARAEQARIMSGFAHDSVKWLNRAIYDLNRPPVVAVNGSPGLGKTHEALRTVVTAALQDGRQVMIFVDKHNLGEQQARDLAAMGIKARTYRARGADDPVTGGTMCLETDRTGAIDGSLGDVSTLACKSAKGVCEFYETCGYQRQKKDPPEVWLAAHQMLFYKLPPFIPQPDIVIIDERFDDAGEEKDVVLDLSLLVHNRDAGFSREDIEKGYLADLRAISEKVYAVLVQLRAPGALRSDMFTITAEDARVAHGLEWKRKLPLDDIVPGMPAAKAIERALLRRDHNQDVSTLTKFWEALAATLQNDFEESLYLRFDANCTVPGSKATVPGVVISARRELQDAIKNIPVLHLVVKIRRTSPRRSEVFSGFPAHSQGSICRIRSTRRHNERAGRPAILPICVPRHRRQVPADDDGCAPSSDGSPARQERYDTKAAGGIPAHHRGDGEQRARPGWCHMPEGYRGGANQRPAQRPAAAAPRGAAALWSRHRHERLRRRLRPDLDRPPRTSALFRREASPAAV